MYKKTFYIVITTALLCVGLSGLYTQELCNDSLYSKQKIYFEKLKVPEAWELTRGSPEVLIGVIDNGFDFFHPDLKEKLIPGMYANGGYHTEIYENNAHGTLVASIIAAEMNNKIGVAGFAPGCKMLTVSLGMIEHKLIKLRTEFMQKNPGAKLEDFQKEMMKHMDVLKDFGRRWVNSQASSMAAGIRYLTDKGVRIINISSLMRTSMIHTPEVLKDLEGAFANAKEKDVLIISGAGNSATKIEDYPGSEENTIIVGAAMLDDTRWEKEVKVMGRGVKQGSCYGKHLTVMAPAQNLAVCVPHDKRMYRSLDGPMGKSENKFTGMYDILPEGATSSAAPVVSALAALVLSLRPDLGASEIVEIIKQGTDDIGEKGFDVYTGYGRVNYLKTLMIAGEWGK